MLKSTLIVLPILYLCALLILSLKSKKPFKTLLITCGSGLLVLLLIHFTEPYIGFHLPLNLYTVGGSLALGIPGVICFLLMNVIL